MILEGFIPLERLPYFTRLIGIILPKLRKSIDTSYQLRDELDSHLNKVRLTRHETSIIGKSNSTAEAINKITTAKNKK